VSVPVPFSERDLDLGPGAARGSAGTEAASERLLAVRDLRVEIPTLSGTIRAARDVSLELARGETLGLVGESGCGKSVTLRSLIALLRTPARVVGGEAVFAGRDLLQLDDKEMRGIRGSEIAMIFQDPMSSLNPVLTVGRQISEVLQVKGGLDRGDAWTEAVRLLDRVGIVAPELRARDYPHQLSGGMRQRVMIAIAISCKPNLLLADEPTTALDVTVQDQILTLLKDLQQEVGMAMIIVSHDMGVIGQTCDDVAVMYAGHVVEYGTVDEVLDTPRHPYTAGLLESVPKVEIRTDRSPLSMIGGQPPDLASLDPGCPFIPRCRWAAEECASAPMTLDRELRAHGSACVRERS
jgi:peptide/nickel transport system ATP-binding protein